MLGENCPHAGPSTAKRNWVCWTSSYSIFCFLFIVQCVASSQALLWIQNWCFPYRLFDRLTESSGQAVHRHIYCHASSLSKLEAKKQRNQNCIFMSLWALPRRAPRTWFSGPLYMFWAQVLLVPPLAVHHQLLHSPDARFIPWKISLWGIHSLGSPLISWPERGLLTGHWAPDSSQE